MLFASRWLNGSPDEERLAGPGSESSPRSRGHFWRNSCDAGLMLREEEFLNVLQTSWSMLNPAVLPSHQTSTNRTVVRVITEAGEFAVKVDLQTHHSVIGGSTVQEHVVERMPRLVPRPVPAVSGELAVTMRSRRIMVSDWATGEPPTDEATTWARIGEAAAALHSLPTVPRDFAVPLDLGARILSANQVGRRVWCARSLTVFDTSMAARSRSCTANSTSRTSFSGATRASPSWTGTRPGQG